jgi:hypothetical protein
MDRGYDYDDEGKDFGEAIQSSKRIIFMRRRLSIPKLNALTAPLYPHREKELEKYMGIVEKLFRAAPRSPSNSMLKQINMRSHLIGWMLEMISIFRFLHSCSMRAGRPRLLGNDLLVIL